MLLTRRSATIVDTSGAQLTYWSLESYDNVPVRQARKAVSKQMGSLMMPQWTQHHHIVDSAPPHLQKLQPTQER